jgi:hypothetical protein
MTRHYIVVVIILALMHASNPMPMCEFILCTLATVNILFYT